MKSGLAAVAVTVAIATSATASQASALSPIFFAADRAPTLTGEIYRVKPNGHRVNLSKSPYADMNPAVSPDGKHVAFISNRGGHGGVYEVGINGRGLVAIARGLPMVNEDGYDDLAWQPGGNVLAASSDAGVWIVERGHKPIRIRNVRFAAPHPWSPDGRVLLLWHGLTELRAVSPSGHRLWTQTADWCCSGSWSSTGVVAVPANHGVDVYDETGRTRFKFHLPTDPWGLAWSADGHRLAVLWGVSHYNLEVTTDTGSRLLKRRVPGGALGWIGDAKVVIGSADTACPTCTTVSVNVRTGKISPASSRWLDPRSADGKLAVVTRGSGPEFTVGAASLKAGQTKSYTTVGGCRSDGTWLPAAFVQQFAGRSVVYENWNWCDPPLSSLYSVVGTTIHRLTNDQAHETQPMASPDGSEIAYVWAFARGMSCKGCSDGIRIATATGQPVRTLTNPDTCTFDDSPTWSPDGTTILYAETGCDNPGELFTVPAAGGTPTDLGLAGTNPVWGPSKIAYHGALNTPGGIWTADPDGSNPTKVANKGSHPAWSASGTLAYLVGASAVEVDGTRVHLPFDSVDSLAWSPDGTRFVVVARKTKTGLADVYTVKIDGTNPVRLTKYYGVSGASWG